MSSFTITTPVNGSSLARLGSVAGLAWTRSTTTATVTQNGHGMVSGDLFNVTASSDITAITVGVKTVTVTGANTFTFTCLNAGATSGTVTANHIDDYLINGGYLTIDTHTRYGLGSNTFASMGDIVMSATLGGTIEFNSTLIRLIPYNTGTGNVPALDSTISQGGASGKLLGVYSAINVAPTTAGSAMPVTGYILVRQWNSVSYAAGALTGIGASATGADRAGWLEIVGCDSLTATVNRLNTFKVRGDYYDFLGVTTDGTRATTYQIPSHGTLVYAPGVEVETGVGTGVYEFYPCAGSLTALSANVATDAVRGKVCWIGTDGLLRFGHDGTNSTGGYIPPAGLKIRIQNIFFRNCTQAAPTVNVLPNATLATRYEFATTGGGVIDIDKASINWYCNFAQAFSVALTNTNTLSSIVLTECASPIAWSNVGVGQEAANTQTALIMGLNFAGGTMDKCTWTRSAQATGVFVATWTDCNGFTITNERIASRVKAANTGAGSILKTRVTNSTWSNTILGGGRISLVGCADLTYTSTTYYDHPALTTGSAIPFTIWDYNTAPSFRIMMDGADFGGLTLCQPYSGITSLGVAGCQNLTLRNLGTAASPLNCGGDYVDATWTRATTTMTVTKVAHGLKTGDIIAVQIVSDTAPKAVTTSTATLWTLASVPTADTFTITVTNAGATSGTMSYYPTMTGNLIVGLAGGAPLNIRAQRCYTIRMRGQAIATSDNSSKNITLENVWITDWATQAVPLLNTKMKGLLTNISLAAQTSVYGTHFLDYYTTGVAASTSALAWTRVTTTATVALTDHNMKTGDLITVSVSSDTAAIILGTKTITATTKNAFTFTCLNAGAASGTITIQPHNSRIAIVMNEPTADTVSQVTLANGAVFTSAGGLYMPVVGHQADFTAPFNIRGHGSFPVAEAIMAGGTIANYDITYSVDNGVTYKNLYYSRPGGGGSNGSTNVTMTSTTGVAVGDYVWGTNIAPLAKVTSITNATTVVVDRANIGTVSGVLRFNQLPSETVADPQVGFPLKVRIKTTTTNATAITSLLLTSYSSTTDRTATYPLDTVPVTVTVLDSTTLAPVQNARVRILTTVGSNLVLEGLTNASGVLTGTTEYAANAITGTVRRATVADGTLYKPGSISGSTTSSGFSTTVLMLSDE